VNSGEPSHTVEVEAPAALSLAEVISDNERIARICYMAILSINLSRGFQAIVGPEGTKWLEIAEKYAEPGTPAYAMLNFVKGYGNCIKGLNDEGIPLIRQAREQAKALGDTQVLGNANSVFIIFGLTPWSAEEALKIAEEQMSLDTKGFSVSHRNAFNAFLTCGNRHRAEDIGRIVKDKATLTGRVNDITSSMLLDVSFAFLDGNLEQFVDILERIIAFVQETDVKDFNLQDVMFAGLRPFFYIGSTGELRESIVWSIIQEQINEPVFRNIPLYPAYQGRFDDANRILERMLERRPNITTRDDLTHAWLDIAYLESAVLVGHCKAAELLLERFKDNTLATTGVHWLTCIARHLGAAAALLERYDEAKEHYKEAIRVCTDMRFRPELALSRLGLAELILDYYPNEKKEALEHLDFAIKEFREMKMQPSMERALRRKDILKA
jgi:tetratricopeptide (TPR) repeat protein